MGTKRHRRTIDPGVARLDCHRPGQRLRPPRARAAAARRHQRAQRGPDRRPGAAAEEPAQRPPPGPPQPRGRLRARPGPRGRDHAEQRAGFLDVYEQTMRRTDAAPHYFFGAAYFDRVLEADRTWLALATAPNGEPRRRLDRRGQRRLPPLLPQRQRRLAPARLADEERRRPPRRALRRARPAAQPRRRHRPRRRAGGVQARLRQPPARPGSPRSWSATRRPTRGSAPVAKPAASSPPTAPSQPGPKLVARFFRFGRGRPGEVEGSDGLAAVLAPGRLAEGADRVERRLAFVGRAAEQVGPGRRRRPRRAFRRWGRAAPPRTSCRRGPSVPAASFSGRSGEYWISIRPCSSEWTTSSCSGSRV